MMAATLLAQQQMPVIEADKDVKVGKLDNGMSYYIRHNAKQKNLADFYIVHDVGAIQEADNQQGLAHFVEHLAFNGTKHFPGKNLITYLEKIGVKFGANLNAGTSWDYTQYLMKDVPTVREGVVDSALLVLHDWSHFIALEPKEVDSERGVIMEELRTRDGASWRSTIATIKALAKGTKYENRNLIGYLDGLKSFTQSDIESFYHTWYRPDYQAVVVVGDIDADAVESKIKKLMADIPTAPKDAPKKEVIVVPDNEEPIISIFTDPEMPVSNISLNIKRKALPKNLNNTIIAEQLSLLSSFGSVMANARLQEIAMKKDAPFQSARLGNGGVGICPTLDATIIDVQTKDGELLRGFEAAYTELLRIARHGFTESEFERAKNDILKREETAYNNRKDRRNAEYVYRYISAFRKNSAIPSAETEWQLDSMLINNLPLQAVNQLFQKYITDKNNVVIANAPQKDGIKNPTEEEIKGVIAKVRQSQIDAYKDNTVKVPLIDPSIVLKGSSVKTQKKNEALDVTEWVLSNGIKVNVKPTKFKADEIMLSMRKNAGLASVSDAEYDTADFLPIIMTQQGVSKFSSVELRKQLSGKRAGIGLDTDDYHTSISGSCAVKDFETMLQLLYLYVTEPRFNEDDFNVTMNQFRSYLTNVKNDPDYMAETVITDYLYNHSSRRQEISLESLDRVSFKLLEPLYKKLFSSVKDFTVTIIGNVDIDTIKPLVEKYIGSLPAKKNYIKKTDDKVRYIRGEVKHEFDFAMQQPKVTVYRAWTGEVEYNVKNIIAFSFLQNALSSRYLISIREEKGGTYGVGVGAKITPQYVPQYILRTKFDTNEQMADELSAIIVKELETIAKEGPKDEDFQKTKQFLLKNWKNVIETNGNWIQFINLYYTYGIDEVSVYEQTVNSMTKEDIKALAQKILSDNNMLNIVMRPKK
ncbi:MAG: insulinase family protein [Alistipes sp.]|nr:insulinase family protein [Candidatus Alistipes equi]